MNGFRKVENRFIIPLDARKLTVREGLNSMLHGKVEAAHEKEYGREAADEVGRRLEDVGSRVGEAAYTLGRGATLHALGSFSCLQSPVDSAQRRFDYVRYYKAKGAQNVNPEDELAFIKAIHEDLCDGLQPRARRWEKPTWASVDASDFAKRALYERAGYSHDGAIKDEVVMVRSV